MGSFLEAVIGYSLDLTAIALFSWSALFDTILKKSGEPVMNRFGGQENARDAFILKLLRQISVPESGICFPYSSLGNLFPGWNPALL